MLENLNMDVLRNMHNNYRHNPQFIDSFVDMIYDGLDLELRKIIKETLKVTLNIFKDLENKNISPQKYRKLIERECSREVVSISRMYDQEIKHKLRASDKEDAKDLEERKATLMSISIPSTYNKFEEMYKKYL